MKFEIAPKSTEVRLNWDDSRLFCFSLNIDGKTGWRLPTKEELNEIYNSENDFEKRVYWSSTETETDCSGTWIQSIYNGNQCYGNKNGGGYVRAVRSTDTFSSVA